MGQEPKIEETPKPKKVKKKRRILRRILISLLLLIVIGISGLYVASKSKYFQEYSAQKVISLLEESMKAGLKLDKIVFKGLGEIELYNLKLITEIDTIASIEKIEVKYHLTKLFNNTLYIEHFNIINPIFKIKNRTNDSLWTYDLLTIPNDDTTSSVLPDLDVEIKKFSLKNANIIYYDSLKTMKDYEKFDENHFNLTDFNILLSAETNLKTMDLQASLIKFSLKEKKSQLNKSQLNNTDNPGLIINQIKADLSISENNISLEDLLININGNKLFIETEIDNYSLFGKGNKDLDMAEFDFEFNTEEFDNTQTNMFLNGIVLNGNENVNISLNGTLSELNIEEFSINSKAVDFNLSGKVLNLMDNPKLDLEINKTKINKYNLLKTVKGIDFSILPLFNQVNIRQFDIKGGLDSANAIFDIRSDMANLKGKIIKEGVNHNISLKFNNIITEKILKNKELNGIINGDLKLIAKIDTAFNTNGVIELNLDESSFQSNVINDLALKSEINDKIININDFSIDFKDPSDSYSNRNFNLAGIVDMNNKNPIVDLKMRFDELEISKLAGMSILPNTISAELNVALQGLELDSLAGDVDLKVEMLGFDEMYLEPFDFNVKIDRTGLKRDISIDSDFLNLNIEGEFAFDYLISDIISQSSYLVNNILTNLHTVVKDSTVFTNELPQLSNKNYNCNISGYMKDISIVSNFTEGLSLNARSDIDLRIWSDSVNSEWDLKSLGLSNFELYRENVKISIDSLDIKSKVKYDNIRKNNIDTDVDFYLRKIYVNDLLIKDSQIKLIGRGNKAEIDVNSNLMDLVKLEIINKVDFQKDNINLIVDKFDFDFANGYKLNSNKKFKAKLTPSEISMKDLGFVGPKDEIITFDGNYKYLENKFDNCKLFMEKYELTDLVSFLKKEQRRQLSTLKGNLKEFDLLINGTLSNPIIKFKTSSDEIYFNNIKVGDIVTDFNYDNKNMTGNFTLDKGVNNSSLTIDAYKFPIDLGIDSEEDRFKSKDDYKVILKLSRFPFGVVEPFIPNLSKLNGYMNSKITFEGNASDGLQYSGNARVIKGELKVDNTNMEYDANAMIQINTDSIYIDYVNIFNKSSDLSGGAAKINGFVKLKDFFPDKLDINISSNKIKLLNAQSKYSMPNVYGDFIISTGDNPLHFYGTLSLPNLDGDVNILEADLEMPQARESKVVLSSFTYVIKGEKYTATVETDNNLSKNGKGKGVSQENSTKSIQELINYNVSVGFLGNFAMDMEVATGTDLYAEISSSNSQRLVYKKKRDEKEAQLLGNVVIKDNSRMTVFGKSIQTKGKVSFPTGSIGNPYLDMEAIYKGKTNDNIKFEVIITLKGLKEELKPVFTYEYDNNTATGAPEEIEQNAISLLVFSSLKTKADGGLNLDDVSAYSESLISNLASQSLNQALSKYGVDTKLEFEDEIDFTKAKVTIKKQLGNGVEVSYGSSLSDLDNKVITFDVPASVFYDSEFLESLIIQASISNSQNLIRKDQEIYGIRLKLLSN